MYSNYLNELRDKAIRYVLAGLGILAGVVVLFIALRVVFGLWLYSYVSNWVTTRLGFDYYAAEVLTAVITTIAAFLLPSVAAFVLFGKRRGWGMGAIIGSAAVVCLLVYTVGRDVCFNRQTGRPLCYYADTPSGKVFSYTSGFDPQTGKEFKLFTREVAEAEEIERRRQSEQERQQQERNRQRQAADISRRQLEQPEQRQRSDEARERQRREAATAKQERAQQRREVLARLEAERAQRKQELELKRELERARQAQELAQQQRKEEARLEQELEARRRNDEYLRRQENERQQREEAAQHEERREQQRREEEISRQEEARRRRKQERDRIIWGTINKAIERIPHRRY